MHLGPYPIALLAVIWAFGLGWFVRSHYARRQLDHLKLWQTGQLQAFGIAVAQATPPTKASLRVRPRKNFSPWRLAVEAATFSKERRQARAHSLA